MDSRQYRRRVALAGFWVGNCVLLLGSAAVAGAMPYGPGTEGGMRQAPILMRATPEGEQAQRTADAAFDEFKKQQSKRYDELDGALCGTKAFSDAGVREWWQIYGWSPVEYEGDPPYQQAFSEVFDGEYAPPEGSGEADELRHYVSVLCREDSVAEEWDTTVQDISEQAAIRLKPGMDEPDKLRAFYERKLSAQESLLISEGKFDENEEP